MQNHPNPFASILEQAMDIRGNRPTPRPRTDASLAGLPTALEQDSSRNWAKRESERDASTSITGAHENRDIRWCDTAKKSDKPASR